MRDPGSALHETRRKLAEYTNCLWAGRETATSLHDVYTERLAAAARMAAMIDLHRPLADLMDLFRQETHAFPRDLLATSDGREARSAFNALGRAIRALEEFGLPSGHLRSGPESIVGEKLSAVSFVLDYLQLVFDGLTFTVLCPLRIQTLCGTIGSNENGFRDRLCKAIGHAVTSLTITDRIVDITFDCGQILIDLAAEVSGPERLLFSERDGRLTVWN